MEKSFTIDAILLLFCKIYYDGMPKKPSLSHHYLATIMPSRFHSALLMHNFSIVVPDSSPCGNCQFPLRELTVPTEGTVGYPYFRLLFK